LGNNLKISVCMASYKGEKFIKDQIKSILQQLAAGDELIISDDGSTDQTLAVIRSIEDPRIQCIINQGEHGYTRNFENALNHATGDIIFLSDQDDIWCPNKVSRMRKALEDHDLVVSDARVVDEHLKTLYESHFALCNVQAGFVNNFMGTRYIGACMAFNRKLLKLILPFPKNQQLCPHDYWITIVGEMFARVSLVKQPLILYRRHGGNASSAGFGKGRSLSIKINSRMYCALQLIKLRVRTHF